MKIHIRLFCVQTKCAVLARGAKYLLKSMLALGVALLTLAGAAWAQQLHDSAEPNFGEILKLGLMPDPPPLTKAVAKLLQEAAMHQVRLTRFLRMFGPKGTVECRPFGEQVLCIARVAANSTPEGVKAVEYSWLEGSGSAQPIQERFRVELAENICVPWSTVRLLLDSRPRMILYRSAPEGHADRSRAFFLERMSAPKAPHGVFHLESIERHSKWLDRPSSLAAPARMHWQQGCFRLLELVQGQPYAGVPSTFSGDPDADKEPDVLSHLRRLTNDVLVKQLRPGAAIAGFLRPADFYCDGFEQLTDANRCDFKISSKALKFEYGLWQDLRDKKRQDTFTVDDIGTCYSGWRFLSTLGKVGQLLISRQTSELPLSTDPISFLHTANELGFPEGGSIYTVDEHIASFGEGGRIDAAAHVRIDRGCLAAIN